MKREISGIEVECIKGDIASQDDYTAVVNAANAQLKMGEGSPVPFTGLLVPDLKKSVLP